METSDARKRRGELAAMTPTTDAKQIEEVLAAAESTARDEINDACPHEPDAHAEGTCEMCDFAFAADAIVQEAFEFARSSATQVSAIATDGLAGKVAALADKWDRTAAYQAPATIARTRQLRALLSDPASEEESP